MATRVRFFFDFISPYAYLAWPDAERLAGRADLEVSFEPILFAGLLNHWGQLGPAEIGPKRRFTFKDAFRRAHDRGVPLVPPATHPFNPLRALRVAQAEVAGEQQAAVIGTFYRLAWGEGGELSDPEELRRALVGSAIDPALLERADDPAVKEALKKRTAEAVELGVFGVPTYVAIGEQRPPEVFWGHDRLGDLERWLAGEDPAASVGDDLDRAPSAQRR